MSEILKVVDIPVREVVSGCRARFIHSRRMTHSYWEIDQGASVPEHSHPHEQVVNVLEGTFELTVQGEPFRLEAGSVLVLAPDVPHSGLAITPCRILDVFSPVREDYVE